MSTIPEVRISQQTSSSHLDPDNTTGSLNPARSFGPSVALRYFPSEAWIYWVGPCLGSCVAVGFYRFVKLLEYETANPGADFNEKEAEVFTFDEENAASAKDVSRPTIAAGQPDYIADSSGVRPSTSRSGDQIPGFGGRVDGADASEAYRNAPRAEEGDLDNGMHPSFPRPRS